ncbi:MAG TPA: CocE/NonD family hydrolase [Thermoanaerobaculia bacterium]|nr:CocE/NonD family hydrolase [Thermoanaerobaculia bacterium]
MAIRAPSHDVVVRRDVMVRMRDGIRLATDVHLPGRGGSPATGRFPALLERTPYDKRREVLTRSAARFAARGYAVVLQDVRGRRGSEGHWSFLPPSEGPDGFDTVAWIARQPWSDGAVGTMGLSYSTTNQQTAALLGPPALRSQFLGDGGYNYHHRTMRHSGAFELGVALPYVLRMARESQAMARDPATLAAFERALEDTRSWIRELPPRWDETALRLSPADQAWFLVMLRTGNYDASWRHPGWNLEEHVAGYPDLPIFLQTSWYGHHVWATTEKYRRIPGSAPRRLLIGHWTHGYDDYGRTWCGEVDFGPEAALDLDALKLRWFDATLRGEGTGLLGEPPVRLFVMGGGSGRRNAEGRVEHGGAWRDEREWPLARSRRTRFYLHPDGTLGCAAPPPDARASRYRYDPLDPVPTLGGGTQNPQQPYLLQGGAFDQRGRPELAACRDTRPLAERADVLVFETAPLERPVEVVGPIEVRLWVASSARDTDFTAKLVDVHPPTPEDPDGFAMNLTDGIVRMRFRDSRERATPMVPGEVYPIVLELQATGNLFAAGHRIRLDLSSSNYPRFDPNPNTGEPLGRETRTEVAANVVFHDATRPSHVVLPVIP